MAVLTDEHKAFLVDELAMYSTPTEAADAFHDRFGIVIDRSQVARFDPAYTASKQAAKKWKDRYRETRERFDSEVMGLDLRIAKRAWRIKQLEDLYRKASKRGNLVEARNCLEQAAKECGDVFSNVQRIRHSGRIKTDDRPRNVDEKRNFVANKLLDAVETMVPAQPMKEAANG